MMIQEDVWHQNTEKEGPLTQTTKFQQNLSEEIKWIVFVLGVIFNWMSEAASGIITKWGLKLASEGPCQTHTFLIEFYEMG